MYATIPHGNTYVASDILLTLDCSGNMCGCHLLHALCNDPFYKPLHPPGLWPSPFLSDLRRRKGEHLYRICGGNSNSDPGAVALVLSQNAPECTLQSLMAIRILQAVSFKRSIARLIYAVVICFIHFATTPSTNLSIPLAFGLPPSSPSSGRGRGTYQTTCTGVGYFGREKTPLRRALPASSPHSTALVRGAMHIKGYIAIQTNIPCVSVYWSLLSKGLRGGKSRRLRVESLLRRMLQSVRGK